MDVKARAPHLDQNVLVRYVAFAKGCVHTLPTVNSASTLKQSPENPGRFSFVSRVESCNSANQNA